MQRRLLYADKEGEMVPGTDSEEDEEEAVRCFTVLSALPPGACAVCCTRTVVRSLTRPHVAQPPADDAAEQHAWSRVEDFMLLAVASRLGTTPVGGAVLCCARRAGCLR